VSMPKYKLQVVLDKRERLLDQAEEQVKIRRRELEAEHEKLAQLERELGEIKARQRQIRDQILGVSGDVNMSDVRTLHGFREKLRWEEERQREKIAQQRQAIAAAEDRLRVAREELLAAQRAVEAVEQHKEKWQKEYKKGVEKKEEEERNEIGSMLYSFRKE